MIRTKFCEAFIAMATPKASEIPTAATASLDSCLRRNDDEWAFRGTGVQIHDYSPERGAVSSRWEAFWAFCGEAASLPFQ